MSHIPWHFRPTFDHIFNNQFPTFINILITFDNIPVPPLTIHPTFDNIGRNYDSHSMTFWANIWSHFRHPISNIYEHFNNIWSHSLRHFQRPNKTKCYQNVHKCWKLNVHKCGTYGSHSKTFSANTWSHFRHLISKIYQHNTCNFNIDLYHITYFFNTLRKEQTIHHNLWHYLTVSDTA